MTEHSRHSGGQMADMLKMIAFLMTQNAFEQYWFGLAWLCS
jgi:hypothetical protein